MDVEQMLESQCPGSHTLCFSSPQTQYFSPWKGIYGAEQGGPGLLALAGGDQDPGSRRRISLTKQEPAPPPTALDPHKHGDPASSCLPHQLSFHTQRLLLTQSPGASVLPPAFLSLSLM